MITEARLNKILNSLDKVADKNGGGQQTPLTDEERANYSYEVLARVHNLTPNEIKERLQNEH